ncbi:DUF6176 family protein [uncultured Shewanella sp.]|uniref:DUF6176 family protein n=1 Tax=uncultured Shewanella sp. TaxID=173975 RepID=UPI002609AF24|nr:DUF6176 family protein [uncultured Shewanella sp.]
MESKLLKIKLKLGAREKLDDLICYMRENIQYPKGEMDQKGYYWDSVFFESSAEYESVYIVIKSEDFSKIMLDESTLDHTPFREVYEKFRLECWVNEPYTDIEPVICFNSSMQFSV